MSILCYDFELLTIVERKCFLNYSFQSISAELCIAYWTLKDCGKLWDDFFSVYNEPDEKFFWGIYPICFKGRAI